MLVPFEQGQGSFQPRGVPGLFQYRVEDFLSASQFVYPATIAESAKCLSLAASLTSCRSSISMFVATAAKRWKTLPFPSTVWRRWLPFPSTVWRRWLPFPSTVWRQWLPFPSTVWRQWLPFATVWRRWLPPSGDGGYAACRSALSDQKARQKNRDRIYCAAI